MSLPRTAHQEPRAAESSPVSWITPATAAGRIGLGGLLILAPRLLARVLGVDPHTARRSEWLGRMVGGRELALGVGTLFGPPQPWLAAQMVADALDGWTVARAAAKGQVRAVPAAAVVVFAVCGVTAEAVGIARAGGQIVPLSGATVGLAS